MDASDFKRCATLLVCVGVKVHEYFAHMEPFHLKPVIIWKGNGATTAIKNEYYDPSTLRAWTPKGVVNQTFIKNFFLPLVAAAMKEHNVSTGMAIFDSCRSHLTKDVINSICAMGCIPAVVPPSTTSDLQWIDTNWGGPYKQNHWTFYRGKMRKRTMPMKRQFTHWVVSQAFKKTWDNAGVVDGFAKLGYLGPQFAELRSAPLYKFVPPQLSAETADKDKKSFDDKVELGAKAAKAEKSMTQKTLGSFGKPLGQSCLIKF